MTARPSSSRGREGWLVAALAVGFVALASGILMADASQAAAYELSIYGATPLGFWLGVAVALGVALVGATVPKGPLRTLSLVLGGIAVTAIAALPVLRGYYFHGTADALTHLGWTRDIAGGAMGPTELFYPGIHTFAVVFSAVTGVTLTRSVLFAVAILAVVAIVFVPLTVRRISDDERAVPVAAFSTFLLFMVHNLGVYLHAHSFSQATFFSALVLFLAFAYVIGGARTGLGVLLAVASVAVVIFHPQQAANLILIFGAISLVQFVHRRYESDHPISTHRPLYAHTAVITAAFTVWVLQFEGWAFYNLSRVQSAFLAYISGRPPVAGGRVQSQTASLAAIGSGIPEMFFKLFLVAAVYTLLTAALMTAASLRIADDSSPRANAITLYLAIGSLAILPVVAAYFAGNIAEHYFRHLGFLFLIAALVGSLALTRGFARIGAGLDRRRVSLAVVLAFAVMLPLSLMTVFPSPFIHKQTQHVTEPHMEGYDAVFDLNDETLPLGGIRQGPWRYSDAIQGVTDSRRYSTTVSNENLTRLPAYYDSGGYLIVTEYDRQREIRAYEELRYTDAALDSVDRQAGVNQVGSNGAVTLYQVPGAEG